MSEAGRIFAQAGANIGSALSGVGEQALNAAVRVEQLRQQEFRNQLSLANLYQSQNVATSQLANQAEQIGLASERIDVERARIVEIQRQFDLEEPLRQAKLLTAEAQKLSAEQSAELAAEQTKLIRDVKEESDEGEKAGGFGEAVSNLFQRITTPGVTTQKDVSLTPAGQTVVRGARAVGRGLEAVTTPLTTTQVQGLQLGFRAQPSAVADTTVPQDAAVNEVQRATPLFSPPGSDISVEEEEVARAIFEQLAQDSREQFERGLKGDTLKDILRKTAQATANIRRRNL